MEIRYTRQFIKLFNKRIGNKTSLIQKFHNRIKLFRTNPKDPLLRDHRLQGKKRSLRAFWVTGDIRVVYFIKGGSAYFIDIGTHNQVY